MLYVHVAETHARELPEPVQEAAQSELDPDKRIIAMLGARVRGKGVARAAAPRSETQQSA